MGMHIMLDICFVDQMLTCFETEILNRKIWEIFVSVFGSKK